MIWWEEVWQSCPFEYKCVICVSTIIVYALFIMSTLILSSENMEFSHVYMIWLVVKGVTF